MLKTLVNCVSKTAEEKLTTMPPVGEITLGRMTDTRKPSKTLKPLTIKLPTRPCKHYFQYIVQYVMGRITVTIQPCRDALIMHIERASFQAPLIFRS